MNSKILSLVILLLISVSVVGQKYKMGKVSFKELSMTQDPQFPEANAVVLYREVYVRMWQHVEVYEKIKILNEEGFDYSTMTIPYYNAEDIKGATYNLVNGEVEKTKLTNSMIFSEKDDDGDEINRFTFPQVKSGSVIELRYRTNTGTTADINLQYDIPIKKMRLEVINLTNRTFRITQNPRAYLALDRLDIDNSVIINAENVPAIEEESYVYNMDLYTARLQLLDLGRDRSPQYNKWEDVPKILYDIDDFRRQVKPIGVYKDKVQELIGQETDLFKKAEIIYNFIQDEIEWNGYFGRYPDNGIRDTFKEKKGDVSDINMLYISMMRSLGYTAYPILASSKGNGIPLSASREAFNYTLAGIKIYDKYYVFDAASELATFNYIPEYMLNWQGLLIRENGSIEWIPLDSPKVSQRRILAKAVLDESLEISGSANEQRNGYYGISFKGFMKDRDKSKSKIIDFDYEGLDIENVDVKEETSKEVANLSYDFFMEEAVEEIGNKLYLAPSLFLGLSENPFQKEYRQFPIDFGFPKVNQYLLTINFPEDYEVSFLPDPVKVSLPNNYGSYIYQVSSQGNSLQVNIKSTINTTMIVAEFYPELREFFKMRLDKENERVILSKKE